MEEPFILPLTYNGKEQEVDAQLLLSGYTHKFKVLVEGIEVFLNGMKKEAIGLYYRQPLRKKKQV